MLTQLARQRMPGLRRIGVGIAIASLITLTLWGSLPLVAPEVWRSVQGIIQETMEKQDSFSFEIRSKQDHDSWRIPLVTYGLGAGWGSVRASSLIPSLAGTVGVPGLLLLGWFMVSVGWQATITRRRTFTAEPCLVIDATSGALIGTIIAAAIAVSDLDTLSFYIMLAALVGLLAGAAHERRTARRQRAHLKVLTASTALQPLGDH